jgi:hypothetical protein
VRTRSWRLAYAPQSTRAEQLSDDRLRPLSPASKLTALAYHQRSSSEKLENAILAPAQPDLSGRLILTAA